MRALRRGETVAVTLAARLYHCARCGYRGRVVADAPGDPTPPPPDRCSRCDARTWAHADPGPGPRPKGRPPKKEALKSRPPIIRK